MVDKLGKFELRGIVGKGAVGVVYEGFDPIIERRVAIKTVRLPDAEDVEAKEELGRFKREAQAAGRLHHPNIVGVYDYGETPEIAYIVMEFIDGETLKHYTDKKEIFPLAEIVRVMTSLMEGLQYSHDRGVVHRDLKPANVMLTKAREVKIADFGIARIESSSMTQAGTMLGTPSYMSPEQFLDQPVDARTDIYSSGIMLFQLLTGEKPFEGSITQLMHKVINVEPVPPSSLNPNIPAAFDAVVLKSIAKKPADRFATAAEFGAALRAALEGKATPVVSAFSMGSDDFADGEATMIATRPRAAAPLPPPPPANTARAPAATAAPAPAKKSGPNFALIGGGAAAAVAILGGLGWFLLRSPATPPPPAAQPAANTTPAPPPAQPVLTAAQREAAVSSALSAVPCTLLDATDSNGQISITGYAGAGGPSAALSQALAGIGSGITAQDTAQTFDGPYCDALNTVRPYHPLFGAATGPLALSLSGGKTTLYDGDLITVEEAMPGYSGYLETDYFSSDGTVFHMYPTPTDKQVQFAAGAAKELGNPAAGGASWGVSAPFGTDMIITIASAKPLFTTARPQDEEASAYLPALQTALQNAASAGESVTVSALPVVTLPKQ